MEAQNERTDEAGNEELNIIDRITALENKNRELEEKIAMLTQQLSYIPNPYNKQQDSGKAQQHAYTPNPYNKQQDSGKINPNNTVQKSKDIESALGKNVMGILSCALIFISAILFAFLVYPQLTTELKLFVMYFFSAVVLAVGILLHNKKPSTLSLTLSGCGCGLIYLSFFLTNIYFHLINAYVLYIILLVWAVPVFYFGRKTSVMFSVIGQIGVFLSVLAGVYQINMHMSGMPRTSSVYEYMFLLFYFVLSSLIYLLPNLKKECSKNLSSMIFLYSGLLVLILKDPAGLLLSSYTGEILMPVVISCFLLSAYILFLTGVLHYYTNKETTGDKTVHVLFVLLGTIFLMLLLHPFSNEYNNSVICLALLLILFLANELQGLGRTNSVISFVTDILILIVLVPLFNYDNYFHKLIIYTYVLMTAGLFLNFASKHFDFKDSPGKAPISTILLEKSSHFNAMLCLHIGWITVVLNTYNKTLYTVLTLPLFILFFIIIINAENTDIYKSILYPAFTVFTGIFVKSLPYDMFFLMNDADASSLFFCLAALTHILLYIFHYNYPNLKLSIGTWQTENDKSITATTVIMYITRIFLMIFSLLLVHETDNTGWKFLIIIFAACLFLLNNKTIIDRRESVSGMYMCIKITIFILNAVSSFNASQYVYSVLLFLIAISSIALGFVLHYKSMRLYGLMLSLISVAKLVLIDIQYDSTPLRAFSFFICGILCFIISTLYQKLNQKYADDDDE